MELGCWPDTAFRSRLETVLRDAKEIHRRLLARSDKRTPDEIHDDAIQYMILSINMVNTIEKFWYYVLAERNADFVSKYSRDLLISLGLNSPPLAA